MTSKNGKSDPIEASVNAIVTLYDRIKQSEDIARETVEIPEWGCSVVVQTLTGNARDAYEEWASRQRREAEERGEEPSIAGIRAMCAIASVVDEKGNPVFTMADHDWLGKKSAAALDRIWVVADRLSGLTDRGRDDIRKNSLATAEPGGDSPST